FFKEFVKRRAVREPLQYITGIREFWSLEFKVGHGVLIPRPETEVLVEETLKEARGKEHGDRNQKQSEIRILDLCTGCGCIAISLAKELANLNVYAIDNSEVTLNIASQNATKHKVDDRVTFLSGNLFQPLKGLNLSSPPLPSPSGGEGRVGGDSFDIVVSNPPYVRSKDIEGLEPEIKDFEPISALNGGEDGLDIIRSIARNAPDYLKNGGSLIMEIAFDQAQDVEYIIMEKDAYTSVSILKDYSGKDRVVKTRVKS
ncbi:MAG: peptide chain release factor N(5)-glutamine methyltransferase, partial [Thermodesulfobacteriota bacterium]